MTLSRLFGVIVLLVTLSVLTNADYLPALHQIHQYSFTAPYSCGGNYSTAALYLSDYSRGPDLLYNGACGSDQYFESGYFSLISLIGRYPLENVSASRAFNYDRVVGKDNFFLQNPPAILSMTYAALLAKPEVQALFAFRVIWINHTSGACDIEYAVLSYAVQKAVAESPGFGWETQNYYPENESPAAGEVPFSLPAQDTHRVVVVVVVVITALLLLSLLATVVFLLAERHRRTGYTPIQYSTPQIQMK